MPNGPEPSLQYVDYCNPRDRTRFIEFGSIGLVVTPVNFFKFIQFIVVDRDENA